MGFNSRSSRNQSKITAWCHKSYILPSVFYLSFGRICNLIVLYFRIYNPNRSIFYLMLIGLQILIPGGGSADYKKHELS